MTKIKASTQTPSAEASSENPSTDTVLQDRPRVIFFGNGLLADAVKSILAPKTDIIFHARSKDDLETVKQLKRENPDAFGVLASFGVLIKQDILDLFEPEGILNIHPSLLPDLRGASPIEAAILRGDTTFGVSVMKLVKAMDAGPVYYQTTLAFDENTDKFTIYEALAKAGASWLVKNLPLFTNNSTPSSAKSTPILNASRLPSDASSGASKSTPDTSKSTSASSKIPLGRPQDDAQATFCGKLATTLSELQPASKSARTLHNEVRAYAKFPKSRYAFFGKDCIIHQTHISDAPENALSLKCSDGQYLCIDILQPAGKKPMDAKSFLNGYNKKK